MVLLVFVDGVGVGPRGPDNPLDGAGSPYFGMFAGGPLVAAREGVATPTDARLGVDGLPQSATGQATIITGENAPARLGRHLSAFPGGSLRPLLRERSLFRTLGDRGLRAAHANVAPSSVARRRVRTVSAMTVAAEEAGLAPRTLDDVRAGLALHHDFTNESLIAYGCDLPRLEPEEAGRTLARVASAADFTAFEYFLTDAAGHARDRAAARRHVRRLDRFLGAVLDGVDLASSTVLLTSDHGNLEDLSTGSHTLNPVATTAWGRLAREALSAVATLADVAPAVERLLLGSPN
jgi:2,3-bisphosphoglycerate-independent phosphoglycerate mutase